MSTRRNAITRALKAEAEEQIKSRQREIKYDIRDFVVDWLVAQFREGLFYVPPYQREFIWNDKNRCRFIESVILGLPIPMMFLADTDEGTLEIVDGAQRIQTLESFVSDDLKLKSLEHLPKLNGFRFSDLPIAQQRKFRAKALRMIVLEDTTSVELRQEIFNRVNTSGLKAKPSEVRRGTFEGPFMNFVKECASNILFKQLCPMSEVILKRREDEELILRFFAYSESYRKFKHDVQEFLDDFVKKHRNSFDKTRFEREFTRMLEFVERYFPYGFAKASNSRATPRVRFEAIAVGVNLALRENPSLAPRNMDWLESQEFLEHITTHASNSSTRLAGRIEFVRDRLIEEGAD